MKLKDKIRLKWENLKTRFRESQKSAPKGRTYIYQSLAILVIGIILGWMFFAASPAAEEEHDQSETVSEEGIIWTCSMHPQIKQPEPGDCPICGMELIPLVSGDGNENPLLFQMTETAVKLANIQTTVVTRGVPAKNLILNGRVEVDETRTFTQIVHVPGRIEQLYVDFTGEYVRVGQPIASIYSPVLVSAQMELLEARKIKNTAPEIYEAAVNKLRLLKVSEAQINRLLETGHILREFDVLADHSGYVLETMIREGAQVELGTSLFRIADLSTVWVMFDVYEKDLQWINTGDQVEFTLVSYPSKIYTGRIAYIDPIVSEQSRVLQARVTVTNPGLQLKPQMFVTGVVESVLDVPNQKIIIPQTAVLWAGLNSVVYVKIQAAEVPTFESRVVTLGQDLGDFYVIESGLNEGESIVTNGVFTLDAAAQLNNKQSMMNRNITIASTTPPTVNVGDQGFVTFQAPQEFKNQLKAAINEYIDLKNTLVESNHEKSLAQAKEFKAKIDQINMGLLKGEAHDQWMKVLNPLNDALAQTLSATNVDGVRKHFITISEETIKAAQIFKIDDAGLYIQYCPMADNDKGAHWLSKEQQIRNPYFGDLMLTCGEVVQKVGEKKDR